MDTFEMKFTIWGLPTHWFKGIGAARQNQQNYVAPETKSSKDKEEHMANWHGNKIFHASYRLLDGYPSV